MILLLAQLALAEPVLAPEAPDPVETATPDATPPAAETDPGADTPAAAPSTEPIDEPAGPEAVRSPPAGEAPAEPPPREPEPVEAPTAPIPEPEPVAPSPAPAPEPATPIPRHGPPWDPDARPRPPNPHDGGRAHAEGPDPSDGHGSPADQVSPRDREARPESEVHPHAEHPPQPAQPDAEPVGDTSPAHEVPTAAPGGPPSGSGLLLPIPDQSPGRALLFLLVMAVSAVASSVARRTGTRLRPGAITSLLRVADTAGRILLVLAGVGFVIQLVPAPLLPALPWAVLAASLALGWSLRDALPDLVAWTQLSAEGSVHRGQWVRGLGFTGRIERIGLRATWLADDRGQLVAVPNRLLVQGTVRTDKARWYVTEVDLDLPDVDPTKARHAIERACMLSPWVAPTATVDVRWDPVSPSRWSLRVQLLEGGFADPFRGALRERVEELLRLP